MIEKTLRGTPKQHFSSQIARSEIKCKDTTSLPNV